jgi:hypothetical protein
MIICSAHLALHLVARAACVSALSCQLRRALSFRTRSSIVVAYRLHTAQHYQTTVFSGLSVTLRHRLQLQRLSYHGGRITITETAMTRPKRDKE